MGRASYIIFVDVFENVHHHFPAGRQCRIPIHYQLELNQLMHRNGDVNLALELQVSSSLDLYVGIRLKRFDV